MKKIFLAYSDPLLSRLHRERLEACGWSVAAAEERDLAVKILLRDRFDFVFIDLARPQDDGLDFAIELMGTLQNKACVMAALPEAPVEVGLASQKIGVRLAKVAVNAAPREESGSPILQAVESALGQPKGTFSAASQNSAVESGWNRSCCEALGEAIVGMRKGTFAVVQHPQQTQPLRDVFLQAHFLAQRTFEARLFFVHHLAALFAELVYDLHQTPERVNTSILRTLSQTIDFLVLLMERSALAKQNDLQPGPVFAIDDDPLTCRTIVASLERGGLVTESAETPQAALAVLEQKSFDLIFVDIGLPEMSGFELCTRIRRFSLHKKTPIVFLTGLATFENRVKSSLSGGNDFLGKPFHVLELPVKALVWIYKAHLGMV
jgi:CheY-like chemotaxis protein